MAFTTIQVSPRQLNVAIKAKLFSKADFVRAVGASKESVLKWTDEEHDSVGMKPEFFRKIIDVLGVTADSLQPPAGQPMRDTRYTKRSESGSFVRHAPASDARSDPKPPRDSRTPAERIIQLALDNGLPPSAIHTASELIKQQERYKSAAGGGHREDEEKRKRKGK